MSGSDPDAPSSLELPSIFRRRRRPGAPASPPVAEPDQHPRSPVESSAPDTAAEPVTTSLVAPGEPRPTRVETPAPKRRPTLAPSWAAPVTGLVVGAATAGLGWLALRGCASLRGTTSCGNPGLLVYLAMFVVAVVLGRVLLASLRVADPGSTSLLAVAVLTVLALVASTSLGGWPLAVALALGAAACFWLSHRVTATYTEPGDRPR